MTHEGVTPRIAFTEAMRMVDTAPACVRDIAGKALLGYNLAAMDQEMPSGLWSGAEAFARQQVERAVQSHDGECACVPASSKHRLKYRPIQLSKLN